MIMLLKDHAGNYRNEMPENSHWCSDGWWEVYGSDGEVSYYYPGEKIRIFPEEISQEDFIVCPAGDGLEVCPICGQLNVETYQSCCTACGKTCGLQNGCGAIDCHVEFEEFE
jgi:hypothetical protein